MIAILVCALAGAAPAPEAKFQCASACMYLLARESGLQIEADEVRANLPADTASFEHMIAAGAKLGIDLEAWRVDASGSLPDEPCIAFVHPQAGGEVGHYVFLRPIDLSGRQFQLLDPPNYPRVIVERDLLAAPRFSGWVLVRARTSILTLVGVSLLALGAALFAIWFVHLRRSQAQEDEPGRSSP